jgi:prepilin-type N-terminal cleavage/methylation domain-containing protein
MKNKKGFTLIELLGVITILVILSLIIIPLVDKKIKNSKTDAYKIQIESIRIAGQNYFSDKMASPKTDEYITVTLDTLIDEGYIKDVKNPETGQDINEEFEEEIYVQLSNLEGKKIYSVCPIEEETGICGDISIIIEDTNPGIICGEGTEEAYDDYDVCHIYSVEDLVEFSKLVNDGKTFENKTIELMNNLDINKNGSYAKVNKNIFGDVNEDGVSSKTLKEELTDTTKKGYKPAGDSTNKFIGTFEGNGKTIANLYINRNVNNIGLIGYNEGTIKGLKVENMTVKGSSYAGLISGTNAGNITSVIAKGNVSGYQYLGLVAGSTSVGTVEAVVEGNVNSTCSFSNYNESAYVGGIVGYISSGTVKGINQGGTITTGNSRAYAYRIIGSKATGTTSETISSNSVTKAGYTSVSSGISGNDGYSAPADKINNIGILDTVLDTYINGDNNEDGYYYDNDNEGKTTIYSIEKKPLSVNMKGNGTKESPYLIRNYEQLKQASYDLSKYYKLTSNINMNKKNPVILGSYANEFTGTFEGNGHTIKNMEIVGMTKSGLFGQNSGTIKGLILDNITSTGSSYIGLVSGINTGNITSVIAKGNVSGYQYLGLVAGSTSTGTIEAVVEGNVNSTCSFSDYYESAYVGGITGYISSGTVKGINQGGTITVGSYKTYAHRIIGSKATGTTSETISSNSVTKAGYTSVSSGISGNDGYSAPATGINNIGILDTVLDTYINGDNNEDGYYYDNDDNGNVTIYSTNNKPLEITMTGSGTKASPYIINNYDELKQASYDLSKYYKLNTDIDFENKNPIILGSYSNTFTGTFEGKGHTIKNMEIVGMTKSGLFGQNSGTIKGLILDNITSTGSSYIGLVSGINTGNITSVIAKGNVSGYQYLD